MIPQYVHVKNSPFVPTVERKILTDKIIQDNKAKERRVEKFKQRMDKKLVDLQVYEPMKPPMKKKPYLDTSKFLPISTQNPYYPAQMAQFGAQMYPYGFNPPQQPVQMINHYSISANGPSDKHSKLSMIYEDALPNTQFNNTSMTVSERIGMLNFVRSVMIKHHDGEEISLDSGENSILSYLKFLELNPYSYESISNNPYRGLPSGMLIYRSCYPIRYDKTTGSVRCAKESIGMNVRIYRMNNAELAVNKGDKKQYHEFDLWREIAYYEYIREEIVRKKVSPNFVMMYGYYICKDSGIDFEKLETIKGEMIKKEAQQAYVRKDGRATTLPIKKRKGGQNQNQTGGALGEAMVPAMLGRSRAGRVGHMRQLGQQPVAASTNPHRVNLMTLLEKHANNADEHNYRPLPMALSKEEKDETMIPNPDHYSGAAMVALTEAPTHSLYSWASNLYAVEGNIRRMTYTGFYNERVWKSILFQLMASLYVMQVHGIYISQLSLGSNVYIKDLKQGSTTTTDFWKYKINGVDYYVPNYGYMVMIDSNYRDIVESSRTLGREASKVKHKIVSTMYESNGSYKVDDDIINKHCFQAFKLAIAPDGFSGSFENKGGNKPPQSILTLMKQIHDDALRSKNPDISDYIHRHFTFYLNNRVGTFLKEKEMDNVIQHGSTDFKHGQLVAVEEAGGAYHFGCFMGTKEDNNLIAYVMTKAHHNAKSIIKSEIPVANLKQYSPHEPVEQIYKPNEANLNDEELLETYVIG